MVSSSRVVFAASCLTAALVDGFVVVRSKTNEFSVTQLYGRRVMKRGSLGDIDSEESSSATKTGPRRSTRQQRKAGSSRKKKGSSGNSKSTESAMSADLAAFLNDSSDEPIDVEVVDKTPSKSERRQKQTAKKAVDKERSKKIEAVLDELQAVLEERTGNVGDILAVVEKLLQIPSDSSGDLRRVLSAKDRSDYRLAWVGSDDAICHLGTGLHKVPLARMQEVFMNCLGRNRIEILEVISLIGPFPNVKNILQGTTKISGGIEGADVQITMEKMIDGTGKTIDAGTDDNIRRVDLEVAFSDERAIVVLMPGGDTANPLADNGKRVMLFVKEDDLDEKLEGYRVNEIE
mmetsp:Transcript_1357/g.3138  ORF Transcript_1357/g.3138 Transcript_1357/m.3138 type:complete len:347 (-) Transcript_1357:82-1122(-)